MEEQVVDSVIKDAKKHFGKMEVNKNNTFDYLGMNITMTPDRNIKIEMKNQIKSRKLYMVSKRT